MAVAFAWFMLGITIYALQAALSGLLALWLGSRVTRVARVVGGVVVVLLAWTSFVPLLDRVTGHQPRFDLVASLVTFVALGVGWIAGRNRRIRAAGAMRAHTTTDSGIGAETIMPLASSSRLFLDDWVRMIGAIIVGAMYLYGVVAGLLALLIELGIVVEVAGFWGVVIAVAVVPVTFVLAPLYAGFRLQDWMPACLCYGGMLTMALGVWFGLLVKDED